MCGISGIFSTSPSNPSIISSMRESLNHRGFDAHGLFIDATNCIALAHNRLSIIDLSDSANQPFHSANNRYIMVFNGEVYNFQAIKNELHNQHGTHFKTTSDTEVIVEAFAIWGTAIATRLEGMFSIVIFDRALRKFFLLRDRAGKKPLYYFHSKEVFVFASEIKAVLRHPLVQQHKQINRSIISTFLHLGYIPEPHTIYKHVQKFPAGCFGELTEDLMLSIKPYWHVYDNLHVGKIKSTQQAKTDLNVLLNNAVQKRLVSDVPLGTFLSGGTDSSLVTAIASKHVTSLKTFNIGFKENKYNESVHARAVSKHLNTNHTEYILAENEAINILETYLHHFDEPFADTSAIPTMLVSKLARQEVKVVLTGDGGDELFQGYGAYTWANRLDNFAWKVFKQPIALALQATGKSKWQRVAQLLETVKFGGIRSHIFSQEQYLFSQTEIHNKLLADRTDFVMFDYHDAETSIALTAGEKQALFDFQYYLKDDLLVKVDRASMFYGLECRCPLLDHHIIAYANTLDVSLKNYNGNAKWILKELLTDYIPEELVNRPKWGFSVPLAKWLKGDLNYLIEDYLSNQTIEEVGLFKADYIQLLKSEFYKGKNYLYNRLWVIIVLHKWWKESEV